MNVSITNACNRRCAYCFQKDWYLSKKASTTDDDSVVEMTVNDFEKLCDWASTLPVIKLLGGEPMLHSQIDTLLEVAKRKGKKITLISNISVPEEQFDRCVPYFMDEDSCVNGFLINTDYPASQEEIFKRNLRILCATNMDLSFSTTLLPGKREITKAQLRMAELANIYQSIRGTMEGFRVRMAPFCPNPTNSTEFRLHDFTDDIVNFVNALYPVAIMEYGFDCPVNLCEMRDDFVSACRNSGFRIATQGCSPETGMPFDVLVDHSVIWCSSANFLKLKDWRNYESYSEARRALSELYYDWWRVHGMSPQCRQCEKLNPGLCNGFCIAKTHSLKTIGIVDRKRFKGGANAF